MIFADRTEAGGKLGERLAEEAGPDTVVLGVPRGGVIVAREVARALGAALDVIVPRKLGAPANPELAIGAVAPDGTRVLDERLVRILGVTDEYVARESEKQIEEIHRRLEAYRGGRPPLRVEGKSCIVVDDGVATGSTALAACESLKRQGAKRVVLAVPVAPPDTVSRLAAVADEVVTLATPEPFHAVGQWYVRFAQVTDDEVVDALAAEGGAVT
jgi:predicted phosphoribosyltransferase